MQWFRMYTEVLNDPKAQCLSGDDFKGAVMAAVNGEGGPLAHYIRPGRDRPSGPVWARLRGEVFERDDYTCQYCGDRGGRLECDHIIAVARGGTNDIENLTTACLRCNRSKRDKTIEEWISSGAHPHYQA